MYLKQKSKARLFVKMIKERISGDDSAAVVVGHLVRQNDGNLNKAAHLAILAPRCLIDEFALSMLTDGVAVRMVVLNHITNDGL